MNAPLRIAAAGNVVELVEGCVDGAVWPLIPDGVYMAHYQGHDLVELRQFRGAPRLFVRFELILAGEHTGKILFRSYRLKRLEGRRFIVGRKSDLYRDMCRVVGVRIRPDRLTLQDFKHCLLQVRTRTVKRDSRQAELPAPLHYSVVADILSKDAGSG